eukprot:GEMP01060128.1.p1 GENE.GEMP01060128.1~~GEMP01060128.1.p1  ORF type:complete len:195 (-),score=25.65 GEMP01060128.1:138-722(-)
MWPVTHNEAPCILKSTISLSARNHIYVIPHLCFRRLSIRKILRPCFSFCSAFFFSDQSLLNEGFGLVCDSFSCFFCSMRCFRAARRILCFSLPPRSLRVRTCVANAPRHADTLIKSALSAPTCFPVQRNREKNRTPAASLSGVRIRGKKDDDASGEKPSTLRARGDDMGRVKDDDETVRWVWPVIASGGAAAEH